MQAPTKKKPIKPLEEQNPNSTTGSSALYHLGEKYFAFLVADHTFDAYLFVPVDAFLARGVRKNVVKAVGNIWDAF